MVEKRAAKRSPIELAASYGIGEDPRPEREAKIDNISSGGFCLTSDHKMKIGEEIDLSIDLDTIDGVIISVKVIWTKKNEQTGKYTVGVQIVKKDSPDLERFIEFYSKQL